jgi:hypothetical protein
MAEIESRPVSDFNRITLRGYGDLILEQGDAESLTIETSKEMLERIKVEVKDHALVISYKRWFDLLFFHQPVLYRIAFKNLEALSVSGSAKVKCEHLSSPKLSLSVSGAGDIQLGDLAVEELVAHTSGSAKWLMAGKTTRQEVYVSGSSTYDGKALESQQARVIVSGSGRLTLNVAQLLDISISGSGHVDYLGTPAVSQSISGSGRIRRIES